jgi:hypothetical protein
MAQIRMQLPPRERINLRQFTGKIAACPMLLNGGNTRQIRPTQKAFRDDLAESPRLSGAILPGTPQRSTLGGSGNRGSSSASLEYG